MKPEIDERDLPTERQTIAKLMIGTIAATALMMAFGITMIAHSGTAMALIAL